MSDTVDNGFGGIGDSDVEGNIETRRVQTNGRVNFPDSFLEYIGVEKKDNVIITAKDDRLIIDRASVEAIRGERDAE